MKRALALILTVIILLSTFVACNNTSNEPAETTAETTVATTASTTAGTVKPKSDKLYVGYGRADITPIRDGEIIPVQLGGYPFERIADLILTNLYTSCTAIRDEEGDTVLLFTVDSIGISSQVVMEIRTKIKEATGILPKNVLITSSHSHATPDVSSTTLGQIQIYNKYVFFPGFVEAAEAAIDDLALCTELYAVTLDGTGYNFIRRYIKNSQGKVVHEIDGDHSMPVVRFVRDGKKDVIFANWAAHADTVIGSSKTAVSGDYYYYFTEHAEKELGAHVSLFNGATGDVTPYSKLTGETKVNGTRPYGRKIADILIDGINSLEKLDIVGDVSLVSKVVPLKVDHSLDSKKDQAKEINDLYAQEGESNAYKQKCAQYEIVNIHEAHRILGNFERPATENMTVSVATIGNIVFATAPYEMLTQTGLDIKSNSKFDLTFVCGYTNGAHGYIAPEYAFANGDYEVYSCLYVKGSAEKIQTDISKLVDKLYTDIYGE